ncbi:MAG: glycerophosphodiester phosphodiesterase, partial [Actinomycetes bacterium]
VRRGWRRLPIARLARRELPAHIPTLADLYAEVGPDVDISLDVKAAAAAEAMIAVGRRHGDLRRLWLCSPDPRLLRRWRALDATVRLVLSTRRGRGGIHPPPGRVAALGADAVNLRAQEWTAELVEACHAVGLAAFGWDAQDQSTLAQVLALGADGVYSDHVGRMTAALRELRASR